jgi:hypothetical protein
MELRRGGEFPAWLISQSEVITRQGWKFMGKVWGHLVPGI